MIGVEGEYKFSIFLKEQKNIISEYDMISFTIIELAGFNLPYFEFVFTLKDKSKLDYFNDTSVLNAQMGSTTNSLKDTELHIEKVINSNAESGACTVTLRGIQNSKPYLVNQNSGSSTCTSSALFESIAKKYGYKYESNFSATDDKMAWLQSNQTDYAFINEVWKHSYLTDKAYCMTAFTIHNNFRYLDVSQMIADNKIKYNYVTSLPESADETQINSDYKVDNNTTINNMCGGYVKKRYVYDMDRRTYSLIDIGNSVPIISEAKTTNANTEISKSAGFYIQNSLMHKNYYKAEMLNKVRTFNMNSSRLWVTIEDSYSDVHPLDLVTVLIKEDNNQSCEQYSGL